MAVPDLGLFLLWPMGHWKEPLEWGAEHQATLGREYRYGYVFLLPYTELRRGYLSYTILKIQRNEYITLMLIYVSIALHVQLALLHHIYVKRGKYHKEGMEETTTKKEIDPTTSNFLFGIKWFVWLLLILQIFMNNMALLTKWQNALHPFS